jgi:hypothetical protein
VNQPPDHPTQPIPADATREQPETEVPAVDTASPAWASAAHEGDGTVSARPVPVAGAGPVLPPALAAAATPVVPKKAWTSRFSAGRGLAVGALVVGLGLGVVAGSAGTWAVTHGDRGVGSVADGEGRFDHHGDGDFGPPGGPGGRGGMPPGGQLPGGPPQNGTDDSPGSNGTGTSEAT